jgi:putative sterol carrier protein
MAEIGSPTEYYTLSVPQQLAAALKDAPESAGQPPLTAIYEITGAGGGIYSLRVAGGRIEVLPERVPEADIYTTMAIEAWRSATSDGLLDPVVDYVRRRKIEVVKSLKGTVRLELQRSDGSTWQSATTFGGQAEPEVTLRMNADDYAAMMRGDLNGQMAFITGKLQFEGSLPLLMQVGALSA